jgi:hypothetical protein
MKRMKKALLLPIRSVAYRWGGLRLYYWADLKLSELRSVYVMPVWYFRWLYQACMWLVMFNNFRRLADWAIHTIPYPIRFEIA